MKHQIFLGGSCGNSTWREKIAIPMLTENDISFYNPQVANHAWDVKMRFKDMEAKESASALLFVIEGNSRSIASIGEACYLIGQKRPISLTIIDVNRNTLIDGEKLSKSEIFDLNRGRMLVKDMAKLNNIPYFENIKDSVNYAIKLVSEKKTDLTLEKLNKIIKEVDYKKNLNFKIEENISEFYIQIHSEVLNVKSKEKELMAGRKWLINKHDTSSDVIRTLFKAIITWEEHEIRELFKYKNKQIFNPHFNIED